MTKFKKGDIVYIRTDIEMVCQERIENKLWCDTPESFYRHKGKRVVIENAVEIYREKSSENDEKLSDNYNGGSYHINDTDGTRIDGYWYDFHFYNLEPPIDVNNL